MNQTAAEAPVALITGGARRIGAALTEALHGAGYRILLHYRSATAEAEALAARLNHQRADSVRCLQARLESIAETQALGAEAAASWGRVDVLVNNASSFHPTPLGTATEEDWRLLVGSNLQGPFFLCQALLPALRENGGCIVNMLDVYASRPLAQHPLYCAAKAGLAMLTRSLARDLGPDIRVNGIAPGAILWPEGNSEFESDEQRLLRRIPLRRMGSPEDIARTALFLVRDAPYISGQIIAVDGGRSQV